MNFQSSNKNLGARFACVAVVHCKEGASDLRQRIAVRAQVGHLRFEGNAAMVQTEWEGTRISNAEQRSRREDGYIGECECVRVRECESERVRE